MEAFLYIKKECKESKRLLVSLLLIGKKIPKDPDSFPGLINRIREPKQKQKLLARKQILDNIPFLTSESPDSAYPKIQKSSFH